MAAFFSLVLSQRYHEIRVGDVLVRSGVSRSTFYEHFRNKDELLAASLEGPFQTLANLHTLDTREAVEAFLAEPFSHDERHARRIGMLSDYEDTGELPALPALPSPPDQS